MLLKVLAVSAFLTLEAQWVEAASVPEVAAANGLAAAAILVPGYFAYRRQRIDAALAHVTASQAVDRVEEIHVLVNGRLTQTLNKMEALEHEVERLGGAAAPNTRAQDMADVEDIERRVQYHAEKQRGESPTKDTEPGDSTHAHPKDVGHRGP